jgi:uncharacterized membrane protein YkvA (DUF1232 family)
MPDPLEKRFLATVSRQLVALPYDMKILFEAITDEELEHSARVQAAGGVMYVVGPFDAIADNQPLIGFVDDVIVLRIVVDELRKKDPEITGRLIDRYSESFSTLDDDLKIYRDFLGAAYGFLEHKAHVMATSTYKGHTAKQYVDDPEAQSFLYDESLAFQTDYDFDEEKASRLKKANAIVESLQRKMAEEKR